MRKSVILIFLVAMVFIISGCPAQDGSTNDKDTFDVQSLGKLLSFSYFQGSYHGGYWGYKFSRTEDDEILFTAEGHNGVDLNISTIVEQEVLDELAAIIVEQEIYTWNGTSESKNVVDGWGFSFNAEYENETLKAGATTVDTVGEKQWARHKALQDHLWQLSESLK